MILLPTVERELRTSARHAGTYHLRLVAAGALLFAILVFTVRHGFAIGLGGKLFGDLHLALFTAIWIAVPFLTADCISRERREGTLGILFLTRLRAQDIVLAKCLAHSLRALTLWLAVLPLITVPILFGGVSGREAMLSCLVNATALLLALAAGLIASSMSRLWQRVMLFAACLSLLACMIFVFCNGLVLAGFFNRGRGSLIVRLGDAETLQILLGQGVWLAVDWDGSWGMMLSRLGTAAKNDWLLLAALMTCCAFLVLLFAIRFVAWRVSRVWHEEPPGARVLWLEEKFCRPIFFQRLFRAWMRMKRERNPIGWLEHRSWTGRLVTWGWLGVVTCLYCAFLTGINFFENGREMNQLVIWLLSGSLALCAAGSFRRERETGVLELLLVSPLHEVEIVSGRILGLWTQFLPAVALSLAIWIYLAIILPASGLWFSSSQFLVEREGEAIIFYAGAFVTLPVIGLYFSLRCRHFLSGFLATLALGMLAPLLLCGALDSAVWGWTSRSSAYLTGPLRTPVALGSQLLVAAVCWRALLNRLRQRDFPLVVTR